jgi:hypothetical protein
MTLSHVNDDKIRDGTLPVDEKHHNCKITENTAKLIIASRGIFA